MVHFCAVGKHWSCTHYNHQQFLMTVIPEDIQADIYFFSSQNIFFPSNDEQLRRMCNTIQRECATVMIIPALFTMHKEGFWRSIQLSGILSALFTPSKSEAQLKCLCPAPLLPTLWLSNIENHYE